MAIYNLEKVFPIRSGGQKYPARQKPSVSIISLTRDVRSDLSPGVQLAKIKLSRSIVTAGRGSFILRHPGYDDGNYDQNCFLESKTTDGRNFSFRGLVPVSISVLGGMPASRFFPRILGLAYFKMLERVFDPGLFANRGNVSNPLERYTEGQCIGIAYDATPQFAPVITRNGLNSQQDTVMFGDAREFLANNGFIAEDPNSHSTILTWKFWSEPELFSSKFNQARTKSKRLMAAAATADELRSFLLALHRTSVNKRNHFLIGEIGRAHV